MSRQVLRRGSKNGIELGRYCVAEVAVRVRREVVYLDGDNAIGDAGTIAASVGGFYEVELIVAV